MGCVLQQVPHTRHLSHFPFDDESHLRLKSIEVEEHHERNYSQLKVKYQWSANAVTRPDSTSQEYTNVDYRWVTKVTASYSLWRQREG